jgi:excisionase family DNA binding protein
VATFDLSNKKIDSLKVHQIQLIGLNLNELLDKIGQLIDCKLHEASPTNKNTNQSKFISRQEVADLLKISLPTLNEWTKLGWLQSYKLGNRVLYKLQEVEQAIDKVSTYKFKNGGYHA